MKTMIAYCGLDCEQCDAYLATVRDDRALREKTAKKWSEMNHVEILPEYINCEGCRVNGVKTYFCEQMCEIRKCAAKKGFTTCGDCAGHENCQTLSMITSDCPDAVENLKKG